MNKKEYAQANKAWLEAKAKEDGVKPLPKGMYYKVISVGSNNDKHPTERSVVTVHYTGRTIDGKQFDSSLGGVPVALRLNELIEGWIIALQHMCIGDKWEIYIPSELGYGKYSQPGIPANSTLIFELELCSIA
jgi:FKBP-type peptidyl-prolyl cis-trans isomerase